MAVQLLRRLFTVDEYYRMAQAGVFSEDDRVELIEGEIVELTLIGSRHAAGVDRLAHVFFARVGGRAIVRVQNPVRLGEHSEPQPDLVLLRPRPDFYAQTHPGPEDVLLVIEVAETSAERDREVKIPLYARAGVPEAWLLDLAGDILEAYRQPSPQGYQEHRTFRRGERLTLLAFPDIEPAIEEILG